MNDRCVCVIKKTAIICFNKMSHVLNYTFRLILLTIDKHTPPYFCGIKFYGLTMLKLFLQSYTIHFLKILCIICGTYNPSISDSRLIGSIRILCDRQ